MYITVSVIGTCCSYGTEPELLQSAYTEIYACVCKQCICLLHVDCPHSNHICVGEILVSHAVMLFMSFLPSQSVLSMVSMHEPAVKLGVNALVIKIQGSCTSCSFIAKKLIEFVVSYLVGSHFGSNVHHLR